jgi:hypothetical protein
LVASPCAGIGGGYKVKKLHKRGGILGKECIDQMRKLV